MKPLRRAALVAALFFSLSLGAASCERRPPVTGPAVVLRNADGAEWVVTVELARTPAEHQQGLMWRWSLAPDHGMLFIFDDVKQRRFWMKNTRIPLDMLFIGPDLKIVGIVENAEPYTETERSVPGASKYVLEVSGGEFRKHGVKAGDTVELLNLGTQ